MAKIPTGGTHELQERYSKMVLQKLRAELCTKDGIIFNNRYEGDPKAGAVKIPVRDMEVIVGDYDVVSGGNMNTSTTKYLDVLINKNKYVNELIDGFEAVAVPDNLKADRLDSAGYSLAMTLDNDAISTLITEGTTLADTTALTKDTVYNGFVDVRTVLTKAHIPHNKRWAIVSPETYALLLKAPEFIHATDISDKDVIRNGAVGQIAGITIYECTQLSDDIEFIVGHPDCCTRINEWKVPIYINDLTGSGKWIGASAVQGRMIYGHKITRPVGVQIKKKHSRY